MIRNILRTGFLNLMRDRGALVLTFVLPIAFFTIFASVFGSQQRVGTAKVKIVVVDEDGSEASKRLVSALRSESGLKLVPRIPEKNTAAPEKGQPEGTPEIPWDAKSAEAFVRAGDVPVAVIIPKGFGTKPIGFGPQNDASELQLLKDSSDPVAPQIVMGLIQKNVMTVMQDVMADQGSRYFEEFTGGLTTTQKSNLQSRLDALHNHQKQAAQGGDAKANSAGGLIKFNTRDILGESKSGALISFYAAGIGVMFLLFSATRAGGSILEEVDSGTLDRLLSSRVTMSTLLLGKVAFLSMLGMMELTVMFLWGAAVFKLDLFSHIPGFLVMASVTAVAASCFGLVLASIAKTRAQLSAISTLMILMMSALGGSMFPRFLMPEGMQKLGLITFNAWALDGFIKVFWRNVPLIELWPQVSVLSGAAIVFFLLARRFARKWEYS